MVRAVLDLTRTTAVESPDLSDLLDIAASTPGIASRGRAAGTFPISVGLGVSERGVARARGAVRGDGVAFAVELDSLSRQ